MINKGYHQASFCKRPVELRPILFRTFICTALIFFLTAHSAQRVFGQDLEKLNRLVQTTSSTDAAMIVFTEGRDLIDDEEWAKAAKRFADFLTGYPKHKNSDAAVYWLAFALKKQDKIQEAYDQLERLVKDYPGSTWNDDGRALMVELAPRLNKEVQVEQVNEEIKLLALQSLFQSNPERAAQLVAEMLKPGSTQSRRVKELAINLLGQHRRPQTVTLLIDLARTEQDPKLRKIAVYWLGNSNDESALDLLKQITLQSTDQEIAAQTVHAISNHRSARATALLSEIARTTANEKLRSQAIEGLGHRRDEKAVEELTKVYDGQQSVEVRRQVISALSRRREPPAQAKVIEIARSASDVEVRKFAIYGLSQQRSEQAADSLLQLFDSERDPALKQHILHSFCRLSRMPRVQAKIVEAARAGSDIELRKHAISCLTQQRGEQTAASSDVLIQLLDSEQNKEIKNHILHSLVRPNQDPRVHAKVLDIARKSSDIEFRKSAINALGRQRGEEGATALVQLFDAEQDADVKQHILYSLSQTRSKIAVRKLIEIARSNPSLDIRKQAIYALGQSRDPEAMKFLEDILK